jgi:hypothetical protein
MHSPGDSPNRLAIDQRGFGRPDPADGPSGPRDVGAYESGAAPADCSQATASAPILWPANHKFVAESVLGVTDVTITGIQQDEPAVNAAACADADGVGNSLARVRAKRMVREMAASITLSSWPPRCLPMPLVAARSRSAFLAIARTAPAEIRARCMTRPLAGSVHVVGRAAHNERQRGAQVLFGASPAGPGRLTRRQRRDAAIR